MSANKNNNKTNKRTKPRPAMRAAEYPRKQRLLSTRFNQRIAQSNAFNPLYASRASASFLFVLIQKETKKSRQNEASARLATSGPPFCRPHAQYFEIPFVPYFKAQLPDVANDEFSTTSDRSAVNPSVPEKVQLAAGLREEKGIGWFAKQGLSDGAKQASPCALTDELWEDLCDKGTLGFTRGFRPFAPTKGLGPRPAMRAAEYPRKQTVIITR